MAGSQEQIFVAVEIYVEEGAAPGPLRGIDAGGLGYLGEGAVAPVEEERVLHLLRPVVDVPDAGKNRRLHPRLLRLATAVIPAEHVGLENVHVAVAIDVRDRQGHGRLAGFAQAQARRGPETSPAVAEPEGIRTLEVVADKEVGGAVAVDILETDGQRPVVGVFLERLAVFVEESAAGERDWREAARAVIEIEAIRFGILETHQAIFLNADDVMLLEFRDDGVGIPLPHHGSVEGAYVGRVEIANRMFFVVADVEVEVAVAVDVRQGHRRAALV